MDDLEFLPSAPPQHRASAAEKHWAIVERYLW